MDISREQSGSVMCENRSVIAVGGGAAQAGQRAHQGAPGKPGLASSDGCKCVSTCVHTCLCRVPQTVRFKPVCLFSDKAVTVVTDEQIFQHVTKL